MRSGIFDRKWKLFRARQTEIAWIAQMVERVLGKDEVTGSIPVPGSRRVRALLEARREK